jgi:hypothetical protein
MADVALLKSEINRLQQALAAKDATCNQQQQELLKLTSEVEAQRAQQLWVHFGSDVACCVADSEPLSRRHAERQLVSVATTKLDIREELELLKR